MTAMPKFEALLEGAGLPWEPRDQTSELDEHYPEEWCRNENHCKDGGGECIGHPQSGKVWWIKGPDYTCLEDYGAYWKGGQARLAALAVNNLAGLVELLHAPKGFGHNHWDSTMRHGAGCEVCKEQAAWSEQVRALLADIERQAGDE